MKDEGGRGEAHQKIRSPRDASICSDSRDEAKVTEKRRAEWLALRRLRYDFVDGFMIGGLDPKNALQHVGESQEREADQDVQGHHGREESNDLGVAGRRAVVVLIGPMWRQRQVVVVEEA